MRFIIFLFCFVNAVFSSDDSDDFVIVTVTDVVSEVAPVTVVSRPLLPEKRVRPADDDMMTRDVVDRRARAAVERVKAAALTSDWASMPTSTSLLDHAPVAGGAGAPIVDHSHKVRRSSIDVQTALESALSGVDPEDVIIMFDFDDTLVKGKWGGEHRSDRMLKYLKKLYTDYPGRVFIYSAGNNFLYSEAIPYVKTDLPSINFGNPLIDMFSETSIVIESDPRPYHTREKSFHFKGSMTLMVSYYPERSGFCLEFPEAGIYAEHLRFAIKGAFLKQMALLLGASGSPKRLVFVDDNPVCAAAAGAVIRKLISENILTLGSAVVEWPFDAS